MSRNSTNFPVQISAKVGRYLEDFEEKSTSMDDFLSGFLRYYQYILLRYMNDDEFSKMNIRGLLVNHHMGLGKTMGASATAISMLLSRRPILVVGKSIQPEFTKELSFIFGKLSEYVPDHELDERLAEIVKRFPTPKEFLKQFKMVTADAYNSADQLLRATKPQTIGEEGDSAIEQIGSLEDTLVVVDEAHNFFRAIVNSASDESNSRRLYKMIMNSKNIRLMFLTGTPVMKDPFELVPCFNMLAGFDILPVDYGQFHSMFVSPDGTIKNKEVLLNRIYGMVSFMPMPDIPVRALGGLPELYGYETVNVEMSEYQYKHYLFAREREHLEEKKFKKRGDKSSPLSLPGKDDKVSSYFVKSRMSSIYVPPQGEVGDAFRRQQAISELSPEAFAPENSPKLIEAVRLIEESPGIVMVYSQFVNYGLNALVGYLRKRGYLSWDETPGPDSGDPAKTGDQSATRRNPSHASSDKVGTINRYAIISGEVDPKIRKDIQVALNDPENIRGKNIRVILVSKTGIEGLNLWYIRRVIILEPYWDMSRIEQLSARGVRLGSHDALPEKERDVRVYILVSTPNQGILDGIPPEEEKETTSIDMRFLETAQMRHKAVTSVRKIIRMVGIECDKIEKTGKIDYGCRLCAPTGEKLFSADIRDDILKKDPCVPMSRSEVKVKKLVTNGEFGGDIYFRPNPSSPIGYDFYEHSSQFTSFINISYDDPRIPGLLRIVGRVDERGKKGGTSGRNDVTLRNVLPSDKADVARIVQSKKNMAMVGNGKPWSGDKLDRFFRFVEEEHDAQSPESKYSQFVILLDGAVVGLIMIHPPSYEAGNRDQFITRVIDDKYTGQGIGAASFGLLEKRFTGDLYSDVRDDNVRMLRLAEKTGFTRCKTLDIGKKHYVRFFKRIGGAR